MTDIEQRHIRDAYCFELGKVTKPEIRARVVNEIIARFDAGLAAEVAERLGLPAPQTATTPAVARLAPSLSLVGRAKPTIRSRKIALVATPGVSQALVDQVRSTLAAAARCRPSSRRRSRRSAASCRRRRSRGCRR
jgi:catalase